MEVIGSKVELLEVRKEEKATVGRENVLDEQDFAQFVPFKSGPHHNTNMLEEVLEVRMEEKGLLLEEVVDKLDDDDDDELVEIWEDVVPGNDIRKRCGLY
ncbi:hypothetical protein Q3G72_020617 [Acer saccharum]|nr:hypothetical protein Q3G72_020617 [Acer saccharum]